MTELLIEVPEGRVAIAIIKQAVKDLKSSNKALQYSAITFFHSEQYRLILDCLGVNPDWLPLAVEALN